MICTVYSHYTGFELITQIFQEHYPNARISTVEQNGFLIAKIKLNGSFFSAPEIIKIRYRERQNITSTLTDKDTCSLSLYLKGIRAYIAALSTCNEKVKSQFLQKTNTVNSEVSIMQRRGRTHGLKECICAITKALDAFVFSEPNTIVSKSKTQQFLDKNLQVIIDNHGFCAIQELNVTGETTVFVEDIKKQNVTSNTKIETKREQSTGSISFSPSVS